MLGYLSAGVSAILLYDSIHDVSAHALELFQYNSLEQHGHIGEELTNRMNGYSLFVCCMLWAYFIICMMTAVVYARRSYGRTEETACN